MDKMNYKSKYHRDEPVRKINVNQTLYDAVMNTNEANMDLLYSSYFGKSKSFNDLKDETDRLATALHRDGINSDDTIGVLLLTIPEVAPVLLAPNSIGASTYWMDVTIKPNDLIQYINTKKMKEIIIIEKLVPLIEAIIGNTSLQRVIVIPETPFGSKQEFKNNKFTYYSDFINLNNDKNIERAKFDKEKPTIGVQSSGSTGKSKSILHTDYNFNAEIEKMAYTDLPFYVGKKSFVCAPPWVIYGLVNSIYSGMIFGQQTTYSLAPKEEMLYENLGSYDFAYGVPVYIKFLYNKVAKLQSSNDINDMKELSRIYKELDRVKVLISGGAKISEEDILKWQQVLRVPIINGYGNNESVGAAIVQPLFANKPGSIGVAMYGNNVKTFDLSTGQLLPDGSVGEIGINSSSLFVKYDGNEEETKRVKQMYDGKAWVKTGDIGYVDKDGYVFIEGRAKRLITDKLGYKISPDNSEDLIQKSDYVEECAVVGVEVAEDDTIPMAFIELKEEYKGNEDILRELETYAQENLKDYECPKLFKEIEKIPHKDNGGKVDYISLEELAAQSHGYKRLNLTKK